MIFKSIRKALGFAFISGLVVSNTHVVSAKGKHVLAEHAETVIIFLNFLMITENASINVVRDHSKIYFGGEKADKQVVCSDAEIRNSKNLQIFCNAIIAITEWHPDSISVVLSPHSKKLCHYTNLILREKDNLFENYGSLIYRNSAEHNSKRDLLRNVSINISSDCSRLTIR